MSYNHLFHQKLRQYGEENFDFSILEEVEASKANEAEIFWINKLKTCVSDGLGGYNMTRGGENYIHWIYKDNIEDIKKAIKLGWTYDKISEVYNISPGHISNINFGKYYYDKNETYPLRKNYNTKEDIQEIYELLMNTTTSMKDLAEKLNLSYSTIKKINSGNLWHDDKMVYPLRKGSPNEHRANVIKNLLQQGKTNQEIMSVVEVSESTIKRINTGSSFYDENLSYPLR